MSQNAPVIQNNYSSNSGSSNTNSFLTYFSDRDPTTNDTQFPIQKRWFNTTSSNELILVGFSTSNGITSANWKNITTGGGSEVDTLTGNSGGAVGSDGSNNINVVGDGTTVTVVGNPTTHTLTISSASGGYPVTPYVVGPVGQAGYQTIQAGITAANAAGGGIVVVQPGTYTENLTLHSNCHVMGLTFADSGGGVTIVGVHTPPTSGGFVFNYVALQSATNIFNSAAAGSAHLIIANAAITVTNGYTFNLPNWTGKLETYDVNDRGSTTDGYINNTGGSEVAIFSAAVGAGTANALIASGLVSIFGCDIGCPIHFVTGSNFFLETNVHTGDITISNNSTGEIVLCEVDAQITMSSSAAVLISKTTINTSSSPAIAGSGAGTLTLNDLNFVNNASVANTLTVATTGATYPAGNLGSTGYVLTSNGPGVAPTFQPNRGVILSITPVTHAASPYTVLSTDEFLAVNVSGGVVTIRLPNTTTTGRVIYVKDSTGGAATSNISITTAGGAITIDGQTTYVLNINYQSLNLVFDGTNYEVY